MSSQTQLSAEIVEQAAVWFVKFRVPEIPESERQDFLHWLQRSPQHVHAYLEVARTCADIVVPRTCHRLTQRIDEPCSAARIQVTRGSARR